MAEVLISRAADQCDLQASLADGLKAAADGAPCVWINVMCEAEAEVHEVGAAVGLHELTVDDIINTEVRPKVEEFGAYTFVVFKSSIVDAEEGAVRNVDFDAALGRNFLVTSQEVELEAVRSVRELLAKRPALAARGPAFILYLILDAIVNSYFPMMDQIDDTVEDIQDRILERSGDNVSGEIYKWKMVVAKLRRYVSPQREMMMALANRPHERIPQKTQIYLRDVYDHIIRVNDHLDTLREGLQGAVELYMSQVSNRMNQVMKTLSIVATIMLPLGILTGLYGTNFDILPGKENPLAFWIFVGSMLALSAFGAVLFKLLRWY